MAGEFTLGCLLGQYDKAQSFDVASANPFVPGSWDISNADISIKVPQILTHSSAQSVRFDTDSGANGLIVFYEYGFDNDLRLRRFPDVTTHDVRADIFASTLGTADSGAMNVGLNTAEGNQVTPVGFYGVGLFQNHRITSFVWSDGNNHPRAQINTNGQLADEVEMRVDDWLTTIDPITIHPEWSFLERANLIKSQHRTLGGKLSTYRWEKNFAWTVPLQYISTSHADLINWWWENQFNLLFTLDTSDADTMFTCRITNQTQPIGTRNRPYEDLWNGVITLESLDKGSLVF